MTVSFLNRTQRPPPPPQICPLALWPHSSQVVQVLGVTWAGFKEKKPSSLGHLLPRLQAFTILLQDEPMSLLKVPNKKIEAQRGRTSGGSWVLTIKHPEPQSSQNAGQGRRCHYDSSVTPLRPGILAAGPWTPMEKLSPPRSQSPGRCVGAVGFV